MNVMAALLHDADCPECPDLKQLAREVRGVWSLDEPALRQAVGNTNYNIIAVLIEKTRALS